MFCAPAPLQRPSAQGWVLQALDDPLGVTSDVASTGPFSPERQKQQSPGPLAQLAESQAVSSSRVAQVVAPWCFWGANYVLIGNKSAGAPGHSFVRPGLGTQRGPSCSERCTGNFILNLLPCFPPGHGFGRWSGSPPCCRPGSEQVCGVCTDSLAPLCIVTMEAESTKRHSSARCS